VIGDECRILGIAEVVEAGSQRGKKNAAAALLQLWHGGSGCLEIHTYA